MVSFSSRYELLSSTCVSQLYFNIILSIIAIQEYKGLGYEDIDHGITLIFHGMQLF